jgi:hypothetical protein
MKTLKLITTLALTFSFLFAQVGNVAAAPLAQDATPITGTIDSIVVETDANGDTIVVVALTDGQSYSFSVETAAGMGLLIVDENGAPVLDPVTGLPQADLTQENQSIEFLSTDVIPDETEEEDVHPISALLAAFFDEDASIIDGYHEDGFGFGVIAQALWISRNLTGTEEEAGDASLVEDILTAKQDKDFETFFQLHPEYLEIFDDTAPTNWGQFKKGLLEKKHNLGNVVSGHADDDESSQPENGNGNGQGHGNGNGHGNGQGNGNGNGNGHGNGHNKP